MQTNVLIIAYAFPPNKQVGALRAGYWYENLPKKIKGNVTILTSQEDAIGERIHIVKNEGTSFLSKIIRDAGTTWKNCILNYLNSKKIENPDIVIITGSPFMHFGLSKWLKKKYNCKVILDYRDPFANNPGFKNSFLKSKIKGFFEREFNKNADALVTVNKFCGELVENFYQKPNAIVQNGYDETILPALSEIDLIKPSFSYTGKYYFDSSPIITAFEECGLEYNYAGPNGNQHKSEFSNIHDDGFVSYKEAVNIIAKNDVAIIQTYGEDFQSTTKIFDYIRCKRVILIVSDNYIERGSIHEELKGYPNVFWSKNDKSAILNAILLIQASNYTHPPLDYHLKYSRGYQMKKLIELIKQITK